MKPLRPFVLSAFLIAAVSLAPASARAAHDEHGGGAGAPATILQAQTAAALRDLWIGHVFWVRNVIVETMAKNRAAATEAEKQVVANARAIAATIEPFYGKAASDKLFQLLAAHYGAVHKVLDASVAGDSRARDAAGEELRANAGEIARFLSGANPNLPFDTLNALLLAHGAHHQQQIEEWKSGDYVAEARTWQAMKDHMLTIADALAAGLAKQFPDRFA